MNPSFPFPFEPYAIQESFMKELYLTIEESKLGIFESPTGKSLSICCSALQWYNDNKQRIIVDIEKEITQVKGELKSINDTEDWLQAEYDKIKKNQVLTALQLKLDKLNKLEESYNEMRSRVIKLKNNIHLKTNEHYFKFNNKIDKELENNKENIPEEPTDDDDLIIDCKVNEDNSDEEDLVNDEKDEDVNTNKIFISSRTHSQLSQFIGEIRRTAFKEDTRVVTLASRQHYCVNSDVARLKNVHLINERCLDMQKAKTSTTSIGEEGKVLKRTKTKSCTACPYYNQNNITKLKERMLVEIMDMEDLVKCGKELKACPYYATRMALDDAQVVLISHAGIVNSGARSGFSLKLKDNVLILDEAHGLTAALENAYSAPVSERQLSKVRTYLNFYINKYRARLSSKNLLVLNQIAFVVGKLLGVLKPKVTQKELTDTQIYTIEDFVVKAEIDHINLRPLVEFCESTRLAPKLHGFSMRYSQQALEEKVGNNQKSSFEQFIKNISQKTDDNPIEEKSEVVKMNPQVAEGSAGSALYALLALLKALCGRSSAGRIIARKDPILSFDHLLLDAADRFKDVVSQCRSVIVAGGTMEPIDEFRELLAGNSAIDDRLNILRCGHVVPPDNVLAVCLSKGPSNMALNFSYETRMSKELLNEVGRILRNICSIVPGGIVCFLPSYSYEQTVYEHLKENKFLEGISRKKAIFREPKSAAEVDQVLQKFAKGVRSKDSDHNGALLLSVVGGKLSEGLNFSDDLGRCVIVIGMPYPNVKSPELQEKMSYLNRKAGGNAGNLYYENLCIKAVNQCIGRAVRHANDYASVLLVDERYSRPQTTSALPSFVQKSLMTSCTFGQTIGSIARFFSKRKENKSDNNCIYKD